MKSGGTSLRGRDAAVLGLGAVALACWLGSYSWVLGLTPPTRWIVPDASPWLVAEVAAVAVGGLAAAAGVALALRSPPTHRRPLLYGAVMGGTAMTLTLLSLLQPA